MTAEGQHMPDLLELLSPHRRQLVLSHPPADRHIVACALLELQLQVDEAAHGP
jgi:hypothetical protein